MGDLSKRLSRHEFACHCGCGFAAADKELIELLEETADHFDRLLNAHRIYIIINSGCRCREYNEIVQKQVRKSYVPYSSRSMHLKGMAADFYLILLRYKTKKKIDPGEVIAYLHKEYPKAYGLGCYPTFTHLDVGKRRRW